MSSKWKLPEASEPEMTSMEDFVESSDEFGCIPTELQSFCRSQLFETRMVPLLEALDGWLNDPAQIPRHIQTTKKLLIQYRSSR